MPLEVLFNLRSLTGYSILHLACSLKSSEKALIIVEYITSKIKNIN